MPDTKKELSFEEALQRLETIVSRLEQGEASLDESIALFQEGMELSKQCGGKLEQAERRVELLLEQEQGFETRSFAGDYEQKGE